MLLFTSRDVGELIPMYPYTEDVWTTVSSKLSSVLFFVVVDVFVYTICIWHYIWHIRTLFVWHKVFLLCLPFAIYIF